MIDIVTDKGYQTIPALTDCGDMNRDNIEAIVKIKPESCLLHHLLQITMRCGQNAHINLALFCAAEAGDLAIFKETQQFDLRRQWQLGNLVEEQDAFVGEFKLPRLAARTGPGEGAFFIAEQLCFNQ